MTPTFKPCCSKFKKLSLDYIDLIVADDHNLMAIANMLTCLRDLECLGVNTLNEIGRIIESYLNRKMVYEACFLGRKIDESTIDPIQLKAELYKFRLKLGEESLLWVKNQNG